MSHILFLITLLNVWLKPQHIKILNHRSKAFTAGATMPPTGDGGNCFLKNNLLHFSWLYTKLYFNINLP